MFNYESYLNEYKNLKYKKNIEEVKGFPDLNEFKIFHNQQQKEISKLNNRYNIIFIYELLSAWLELEEKIVIIDAEKDNVVIIDSSQNVFMYYTIGYEDIKKIKNIMSNYEIIFEDINIMSPPVLDGTQHRIYISNKFKYKFISCANIWYWFNNINLNSEYILSSEKEKEYTKKCVEFLKEIQLILDNNCVDFKIIKGLD